MRYAPMRFDGLSLRHNPEKLSISGKSHIREYNSPCCESDSMNLGTQLRRVTGEGEFCGTDCLEQYRELERLQIGGRRAKLVLPDMKPMYAYLKELSVTAKPADDVLSYRFVFVEAQSARSLAGGNAVYVTADGGGSLWDISYAFGVPVERLVGLNPQIPFIDELRAGERVRIC